MNCVDTSALADDPDLVGGLAIADQLADAAIWHGDRCVFHGAVAASELGQPPLYETTGADAYGGTSGIARFLYLAAGVSGDPRHLATAQAALRHALSTVQGYSLFSGSAGVGVIAIESSDPEFREAGLALVDIAVQQAKAEKLSAPADLLSGLAGVIYGLDMVLEHDPSGRWQSDMVALGETLIAMARQTATGWSWPVYPGSDVHLCGLAHGASGVALAMDCLARRDPSDRRWIETARQARCFERTHYSAEAGSWADLRRDVQEAANGEEVHPHMWCHGSLGVAAERLTAANDKLAEADRIAALHAVQRTIEQVLSGPLGPAAGDELNGSLCHGVSSGIDVLLDAALLTACPTSWHDLARQATAAMREDAKRPEGWRCGVPGGYLTPSLMLGLAGIGWTQLRCAAPQKIPSGWRIGARLKPAQELVASD